MVVLLIQWVTDLYSKTNITYVQWCYLNKYWSHLRDHCKKCMDRQIYQYWNVLLPVSILKVSYQRVRNSQ